MTEPESQTLAYLRRIDEKLDKLVADSREDRTRIGAVERIVSNIAREQIEQRAEFHSRLDRIAERLDRIEKRLGLVEVNRS